MKQEIKQISQQEIRSKYLNFDFPKEFPFIKDEEFWITGITDGEERYLVKRHTNTQITCLSEWFRVKQISNNTKILFHYDEKEQIESKRVLRIEFISNESKIISTQNNDLDFSFKLESELEIFIANNINSVDSSLSLFKRQFSVGDGIIDLLCHDKEKNYVIIELKNKKTSDKVVGQIARYMGWVKENLIKSSDKKVKGLILTPEIDYKLEYAVSMIPDVQVKYFQIKINFVNKEDLENS